MLERMTIRRRVIPLRWWAAPGIGRRYEILAVTGREAVFVRQLVIMASLLLVGCAAPGASGMSSFMSTMHPTQEFCASRGMTLDSATKQCATAPPAAASQQTKPPSELVTGSLAAGRSRPSPCAVGPINTDVASGSVIGRVTGARASVATAAGTQTVGAIRAG